MERYAHWALISTLVLSLVVSLIWFSTRRRLLGLLGVVAGLLTAAGLVRAEQGGASQQGAVAQEV